jgi:hypothetical protein
VIILKLIATFEVIDHTSSSQAKHLSLHAKYSKSAPLPAQVSYHL